MEIIALLLLAPLIWSSPSPAVAADPAHMALAPAVENSRAHIKPSGDHLVIMPPQNSRLTMVVLEHAASTGSTRGPASVGGFKIIEVIVSAP